MGTLLELLQFSKICSPFKDKRNNSTLILLENCKNFYLSKKLDLLIFLNKQRKYDVKIQPINFLFLLKKYS